MRCNICSSVSNKNHSVFKSHSSGCRECYLSEISKTRSYGYLPDRSEDIDCLYILTYKSFTKVGRSFGITGRLKQLKLKAREEPLQINIFTGIHEQCFNLEQYILEKFKHYKVQGWSIELLSLSIKDEVIEILNKEKMYHERIK